MTTLFQKDCIVITDQSAPKPLGAYSHAVKAGPFVFLSGIGARDPQTNKEAGVVLNNDGSVASYDIAVQTRAVLANVESVLQACGCTMHDVVDIHVFLGNIQDFAAYNRVYIDEFQRIFNGQNLPSRTTVESKPPGHNYIEMKVIALCPSPKS